MKKMLKLGLEGEDKITGFRGILTAHVKYITGCDQYGLTPKAQDGKTIPAEFFDEGRITIVGNGILPEEIQTKVKGGPNRDAPRN